MTTTKGNILLVEDEAIIALAKKAELENYGYTVHIVHSGEKAIKHFSVENGYDCILMDIDLGKGLDGTETAELILKEKDLPLLFLSSHSEPEIVEKTEKITSYGYVVKESDITVLDASIKMAFKLFDAKMKTEKQKEEVRKKEEHLNLIFNSTSDLMALILIRESGQYYFTSVNNSYIETANLIFNTSITSSQLEGIEIHDIATLLNWPEALTESIIANYRKVINTKKIVKIKEPIPSINGLIYLESKYTPIFDKKNKKVTYILFSSRDVTAYEMKIQELTDKLK